MWTSSLIKQANERENMIMSFLVGQKGWLPYHMGVQVSTAPKMHVSVPTLREQAWSPDLSREPPHNEYWIKRICRKRAQVITLPSNQNLELLMTLITTHQRSVATATLPITSKHPNSLLTAVAKASRNSYNQQKVFSFLRWSLLLHCTM